MAAWHLTVAAAAKAVFGSLLEMSEYQLDAKIAWYQDLEWAREIHRDGPHIVDVERFQCFGVEAPKNRPTSRRRRETWEQCCGCTNLALALQNVGRKIHASDISYDVLSPAAQNSSDGLCDGAIVLQFF